MNRMRTGAAGLVVFVGLSIAVAGQNRAADYTQWRGPNRDGGVASFTPPASWPETLTQKWKVEVGTRLRHAAGRRQPHLSVLARGRQRGDERARSRERARSSGATGYPAAFTMHPAATRHGLGPKSTPVFADGKLFSIGMTGVVTAFDAATGKQLWQKPGSMPLPMFNSHSFSPIVDRGLVIFHTGGHMAGRAHRLRRQHRRREMELGG